MICFSRSETRQTQSIWVLLYGMNKTMKTCTFVNFNLSLTTAMGFMVERGFVGHFIIFLSKYYAAMTIFFK